jgi:hypothetical protein
MTGFAVESFQGLKNRLLLTPPMAAEALWWHLLKPLRICASLLNLSLAEPDLCGSLAQCYES